MSDDPPTPPADLPEEVVDALADRSPERLRELARYAEELADYRASERRTPEDSEDVEPADEDPDDADAEAGDDLPDDRPPGVPGKATITIKEINDNRYYYWQWRDGDTVSSKYAGPVDPEE